MTRGLTCSLLMLATLAPGCGDDRSPAPGVRLHPVPGCETIDPAPCDVFDAACQTRLLALAACMRGSAPGALPPVSRMTEPEFVQLLTAELLAEQPTPNLDRYEAALVRLGLVAPGAFTASSMAAATGAFVWGFYRFDSNDIVLIDRGLRNDDVEVNSVLLHELVHALQDRDQDLEAWYDQHAPGYDGVLATMSIVEGEARMHQNRFTVSLLGLDPSAVDWSQRFENTTRRAEAWVRMQPSPYLASYSGFPYEFGARLLHPRFTAGGPQVVTELFASPHTDTRAVMDYQNEAATPDTPALIAPTPPSEWTLMHETTLGAWMTYVVLARHGTTTDTRQLALRWRGDRFWVYGAAGSVETTTTGVWTIVFADADTAATVVSILKIFYNVRQSGNVVTVVTNAGVPVDWAFAAPTGATAAFDTTTRAARDDASAVDWLSRVFGRRAL